MTSKVQMSVAATAVIAAGLLGACSAHFEAGTTAGIG